MVPQDYKVALTSANAVWLQFYCFVRFQV